MSPKPLNPPSPARSGPANGRLIRSPLPAMLVLVLGAAAMAALLGYGLAHSLQPLLAGGPGAAGLLGAVVGAGVAAVAVPLALWGRWPELRRRSASAAKPASPVTRPPGKVVNLHLAPQPAGAAARPAAAQAIREAGKPARDALAGAYSQQHFVAAADREWSRIRRHGEDAALLMVDVDHFKALNDQHGQACGDALLVEFTRQVSATLRQYDLLARFGGGVLVVYLPHTDPIGALDVAERIRERVAAVRLEWNGQPVKATVSAGVTGIGAGHAALEDVIADAGAALREAKAAGRNCVRAAPIPPRHSATNGSLPGARRPAGPV